MLHSDILR